jgi:phosphopantothenoylcysteine decarboxylase / phosphopantothenate---cysteine ligase
MEKVRQALSKPLETLSESIEKDKWNADFELTKLKSNQNKPLMLQGKKVLITAGPTYERIDDVRFIGNFSSGRMGFEIASAARNAGAEVILIAGPVSLPTPEGVTRLDVESARQMYDAVTAHFPECDIVILAAAVADYRPKERFEGKIKKLATGSELNLELESTDDILAHLGSIKTSAQRLVGFALESSNARENALRKLHSKNCDLIVLNYANLEGSGFGTSDNTITIFSKDGGEKAYPKMSKTACAEAIIAELSLIINS